MRLHHAPALLLALFSTMTCCSEEPTVIEGRYTQTVTLKLSVCLDDDVRQVWAGVVDAQIRYPGSVEATYANDALDCVLEATSCFEVYQCLGHDTTTACSGSTSHCENATVKSCTSLNSKGYGWVHIEHSDRNLHPAMGNTRCMVDEDNRAGCYADTCAEHGTSCSDDVIHQCSSGHDPVGTSPDPVSVSDVSSGGAPAADVTAPSADTQTPQNDDVGPVEEPPVEEPPAEEPVPETDPYLLHTTDCAMRGQQCVSSDTTCTTAVGKSCEQDQCDGKVLETCGSRGVVVTRMDCADLGPTYRCVESPETNAQCRSVDELECEGSETLCVGETMHLCMGGAWQIVHCSAFMGAECDADDRRCQSPIWQNTAALITPDNPAGLDDGARTDL